MSATAEPAPTRRLVTESHIWLDERGRAWIDDTNVKVIEVVLDKLAHGAGAEEIQAEHPHLSLAQIHAALAYYYDHQEEIDAQIERQVREFDAMRAEAEDTPFEKRLRQMKAPA